MTARKIFKNKKGITLLEVIVYTAISSIILVFILKFSWNIFGTQARVGATAELTQNGRMVLEKIGQDIREAEDFLPTSIFDSNPGVLSIDIPDGDDITFDTYTKEVLIGNQNMTIRKLRRTEAGNSLDLTTDKVDVTNFLVKNRSRPPNAKNVKIELGFAYANPGNDMQRNKSIDLETSFTLRIK